MIGALINKTETDRGPLTLAQAKRHRIRHARCLHQSKASFENIVTFEQYFNILPLLWRFPLKRTLGVQAEMNVDACVGVMCDMKAFNVSPNLWQSIIYSLKLKPNNWKNYNHEHSGLVLCMSMGAFAAFGAKSAKPSTWWSRTLGQWNCYAVSSASVGS